MNSDSATGARFDGDPQFSSKSRCSPNSFNLALRSKQVRGVLAVPYRSLTDES
jgi:hypothetical protein